MGTPAAVIQSRWYSEFDWRGLTSELEKTPRTRCLAIAVTEAFKIGQSGSGGEPRDSEGYYRALAIGEAAAGLGRAGEKRASEALLRFPQHYVEHRSSRVRFEDTKANLLDVLGRTISTAVEIGDARSITDSLLLARKLAGMEGKGGYELLAPVRLLIESGREKSAVVLLAAAAPAMQADLLGSLFLTPATNGGALSAAPAIRTFVENQIDSVGARLDANQHTAHAVITALGSEIDALHGAPGKRKAEIDQILVPEIRGWALGAQAAGLLALPLAADARMYLAEEPFRWMRIFIEERQLNPEQQSQVWREFSLALLRSGTSESRLLARRAQENCEGFERVVLETLGRVEEFIASGRLDLLRDSVRHRMLHLQQSDRILLCAEICSYAASRPGNFSRNAVAELAVQQVFGPVPRLRIPPNIVDQIAGPLSKLGMCQLAVTLMGPPRKWELFDFQRGAVVACRIAAHGDLVRGYELLTEIHSAAERYLIRRKTVHERAVSAVMKRAAEQSKRDLPALSPDEVKALESIVGKIAPPVPAEEYRQRLLRTWRHDAERVKMLSGIAECYAAIGCLTEAHNLFSELSNSAASQNDPRLHYIIAKHASRGNRPDRTEYFEWRRFSAQRPAR